MALEKEDLEDMEVNEEHFAGLVPTKAEKLCWIWKKTKMLEFERLKEILEEEYDTGVDNLTKSSTYIMANRYEDKVDRLEEMRTEITQLTNRAKKIRGKNHFRE